MEKISLPGLRLSPSFPLFKGPIFQPNGLTLLYTSSSCSTLTESFRAMFGLLMIVHCVVPENIHTPTMEGIGNSGGVRGSKAQENPEERRVKRINYFPKGQLRFILM